MLYRMIVNVVIFTLGYYLGREIGRTEGIRELLHRAREEQGNVYPGEAEIVKREETAASSRSEASSHKSA